MVWKDNAYAWYEYALKTGDDSVARFMMHWIAFNFKYSDYCEYIDGKRNSERDQIEQLCKDRYDDLKQCKLFYNPDAMRKLLEYPVLRKRRRPRGSLEPKLPVDRQLKPQNMMPEELWGEVCLGHGLKRIQCILITLYQVRCNLFHGSKDPNYPRDRELIEASAALMQACMEALLHIEPLAQQAKQ